MERDTSCAVSTTVWSAPCFGSWISGRLSWCLSGPGNGRSCLVTWQATGTITAFTIWCRFTFIHCMPLWRPPSGSTKNRISHGWHHSFRSNSFRPISSRSLTSSTRRTIGSGSTSGSSQTSWVQLSISRALKRPKCNSRSASGSWRDQLVIFTGKQPFRTSISMPSCFSSRGSSSTRCGSITWPVRDDIGRELKLLLTDNSTGIVTFTQSYFNLVCGALSQRFHQVCKEIERLAEEEPGPPGSKNEALTTLYYEHNEVCELVDESNTFWQSHIFFTYMTYIPCGCYTLYNLFFAEFDDLLGITTWTAFVHTIFVIGFVSISAASVSAEVRSCQSSFSLLIMRLVFGRSRMIVSLVLWSLLQFFLINNCCLWLSKWILPSFHPDSWFSPPDRENSLARLSRSSDSYKS